MRTRYKLVDREVRDYGVTILVVTPAAERGTSTRRQVAEMVRRANEADQRALYDPPGDGRHGN